MRKNGGDFEVVAVQKIDQSGFYRESNIEISTVNHVFGPMAKEKRGKILLGEKI